VITAADPESVHRPGGTYSHSVRVDLGATSALLFISGQVAIDQQGTLVGAGDAGAQAEQAFRNIDTILRAHDATFADVAYIRTFIVADTPPDQVERARAVRGRYLSSPAPASTTVFVAGLISADWLIEIDVIAVLR
jgi:2-iminobutanoate/2-iminopropanoate deaminase